MLCHGTGGEEHAGAPLDEQTLLRIRVVAHPEFLEIGHQSVVDTPATAGTALDDKVGILGADALQRLLQSQVVVDIQMALVVGTQIV